jgi:cell pole-organizing protein PopZ
MHDDLMDPVSAALVSPVADSSVSSSFNALATSMMLQNNTMVEDSIREMLRPMLKTWLDDNLPGIVERLVRQEIERMARGHR